jgi:hypothetical protein
VLFANNFEIPRSKTHKVKSSTCESEQSLDDLLLSDEEKIPATPTDKAKLDYDDLARCRSLFSKQFTIDY